MARRRSFSLVRCAGALMQLPKSRYIHRAWHTWFTLNGGGNGVRAYISFLLHLVYVLPRTLVPNVHLAKTPIDGRSSDDDDDGEQKKKYTR